MDAEHKSPLAAFVVVTLASGLLLGQATQRPAERPATSAESAPDKDVPHSAGPASGGRAGATVGPSPAEPGADARKSIGTAPVLAPLSGPEVTVLISAPIYDADLPPGTEGEATGSEGVTASATPDAQAGEPEPGSTSEPSSDPSTELSPSADPTPSVPPKTKPTPSRPPRPTPPGPTGPTEPDVDDSGPPDTRPTMAPTGGGRRP